MEEKYTTAIASADELRVKRSRNTALICYILQCATFALILTPIVALILGYVERPKAKGTWVHSHFTWQIKTFWWGLLCVVVTAILIVISAHIFIETYRNDSMGPNLFTLLLTPPLVYLIPLGFAIWLLYRIVKGMIRLFNGQPI